MYPSARRTSLIAGTLLYGWGTVAQPVCDIDLGPDHTICQGTTVTLQGPAGYSNHLWSTGAITSSITVGTAGSYWCQVSYPSGQLVTNGDFNAGNTGFSTMFTANSNLNLGDGHYWVGTNPANHHPQFSGTGNGSFMIVNSGWASALFNVWCQGVTVCPEQTYTLSYRARTISNATPARLQWWIDGAPVGPEVLLPAFGAGWQTITQSWTTAPGQTNATICLRAMSGEGVGNDFGLDDISLTGLIILRDTVQVNVTPLPVVNLGPDVTICAGDQVTFNATVPGGTYLWHDGSTNATFTTGSPGPVSVTVTANNCSNSDLVQVNVTPLPIVNLGPDVAICAGDQITFNATVPGGTYLWHDGSTAPTFTTGTAGPVSVTVTANNCSSSDVVQVSVTPLPIVDLGPDATICAGDQITFDATLPGGSYLWHDGSTNATFTTGNAGPVSVTVTANNCSNSDLVQVSVTPLPNVNLGPDVTICAGDQAVFNATAPGANYVWHDGSTAPTFTTNAAGTVSVTVTANNCSATDDAEVFVTPLPAVNIGPGMTICDGDQVTFDATVPGGSYLWQDGSTAPTFVATTAGTYSVTVTANNCSTISLAQLNVTPLPAVNLGPDVTLCAGDQVTFNATVPGGTYLWHDGSTTPTFTTGTAGPVSVTVTANNCSASDVVQVNVTPLPAVNLGPDVTLCAGDQVNFNVMVPGGTYLWHDGSTTPTFTTGTAGPVSVTVTANNCSNSDVVQVNVTPLPTVNLGPDVTLCAGDQVTFNAMVPGGTYLWHDGSTAPTFTTGTTGTVSVTVTANNCSASDDVQVTVVAAPVVDLGPDTGLCPGDVLNLAVNLPGASFLWHDGSTASTFTATTPGLVSVQATLGSCSASDAMTIVGLPAPVFDLGNDTTLCPGGTLLLAVNQPGSIIQWQDGSGAATFLVQQAGTYSATVTNTDGCSATDAITVAYAAPGAIDLGPDQQVCQGAAVVLDATLPGAQYQWSTGATTPVITVTTTGTYGVIAQQGNCSVGDTVTITMLPSPAPDLGPDLTLCAGDAAVLDPGTPGAQHVWSTGSQAATLSVNTAGSYWVTSTLGPCSASDTVMVTVLPLPVVDLGPDRALCPGDAALLDATTLGATYQWNTGATSATLSVNSAGAYSVTVTVGGCSASDVVQVTLKPAPAVELGNDTTLCAGDHLLLTTHEPLASVLWSDGSTAPDLDVTLPGMYSVVLDLDGCIARDSIAVQFLDLGTVDLGPDTALCPGTSLVLSVNAPGAQVLWQNGSNATSQTVSTPGVWSVTISLAGCAVQDSIQVGLVTMPVEPLGPDAVLCPGDDILLSAPINAAGLLWSDGSTVPTLLVSQAGTVTLSGMIAGCPFTDAITITEAPLPLVDLGADRTLCEGERAVINAAMSGATAIVWSTGATGPVIEVADDGLYSATVTGSCGTASDSVRVVIEACGPFIFVPNAFTPEGDGINDRFTPVLTGEVITYRFDIFDRWGERIFTTDETGLGWDGSMAGQPVPDGVYAWVLTYKARERDGLRTERLTGHVTLLR